MTKLLCQNVLQIDLHTLEYVKIVKCYAHHIHHMVTHCSEMSYYTLIYAFVADQHDLIASQSPLTTTSYPSSVIGHWKVYWHLHNMFSYLINLPIRMVTGVYGSLPYLIRLYLPSPKTLYHFAKWFMSKTPYLPIISRKLYRKFTIKFVYQLQRNISWQKTCSSQFKLSI